jgi:uncharacterized protein YoxC
VGVLPGLFALQQAIDPTIVVQLERIAISQMIIAACMLMILLAVIGGALMSYRTLRSAARLLRAFEQVVEEIVPRMDPLIEKATRIADDANDVTDSLRRKIHEATATLEELNLSLRRGGRAAEQRVREFGAVLEVVQEETESLLLDAAATARGVHTTAETLRERRPRRAGTAGTEVRTTPLTPPRVVPAEEDE